MSQIYVNFTDVDLSDDSGVRNDTKVYGIDTWNRFNPSDEGAVADLKDILLLNSDGSSSNVRITIDVDTTHLTPIGGTVSPDETSFGSGFGSAVDNVHMPQERWIWFDQTNVEFRQAISLRPSTHIGIVRFSNLDPSQVYRFEFVLRRSGNNRFMDVRGTDWQYLLQNKNIGGNGAVYYLHEDVTGSGEYEFRLRSANNWGVFFNALIVKPSDNANIESIYESKRHSWAISGSGTSVDPEEINAEILGNNTIIDADGIGNALGSTIEFYGEDNTFTTISSEVILEDFNVPKSVYAKITSFDGSTEKYYKINITRLYFYTLTYDPNHTGDVPYDTYHGVGSTVNLIFDPTRNEYVFGGWKLNPVGDEADYKIDGTTSFVINNDTILYAHWNTIPIEIITQPENVIVGEWPALFSVQAIGTSLSYQWQELIDGIYENIDEETLNTLLIYNAEHGSKYRVLIDSQYYDQISSDVATLLVPTNYYINLTNNVVSNDVVSYNNVVWNRFNIQSRIPDPICPPRNHNDVQLLSHDNNTNNISLSILASDSGDIVNGTIEIGESFFPDTDLFYWFDKSNHELRHAIVFKGGEYFDHEFKGFNINQMVLFEFVLRRDSSNRRVTLLHGDEIILNDIDISSKARYVTYIASGANSYTFRLIGSATLAPSTFNALAVRVVDPIEFVNIEYDANDSDGGFPPNASEHFIGAQITIDGFNDLYKGDKYFAGWDTEPNGTGIRYIPGDVIFINEDMVLYAQWVTQNDTIRLPEQPVNFADVGLVGKTHDLYAQPGSVARYDWMRSIILGLISNQASSDKPEEIRNGTIHYNFDEFKFANANSSISKYIKVVDTNLYDWITNLGNKISKFTRKAMFSGESYINSEFISIPEKLRISINPNNRIYMYKNGLFVNPSLLSFNDGCPVCIILREEAKLNPGDKFTIVIKP